MKMPASCCSRGHSGTPLSFYTDCFGRPFLSGAPGKGEHLEREHELRRIFSGSAQPLDLGFKLWLREFSRPHELPVLFLPVEVRFCGCFLPRPVASVVPDFPSQFFIHSARSHLLPAISEIFDRAAA